MTTTEVDVAWKDVMAVIGGQVPGIPGNATDQFDITRHGVLDHFQREALRFLALDLDPHLEPGRVSAAATLGELVDLIGADVVVAGRLVGRDSSAMRTARIRLVPVEPRHINILYLATTEPQQSYRWRYRGRTPSPDEFQRTLFGGVVAQFMVEDHAGHPIGLVVAYDEDPGAGHCQIGFIRCTAASAGSMVEAMGLFINYVLRTFNYRKLFADLPEYNLGLIDGMAGELVKTEGRLTDYFWHGGRYWDRCFISINRSDWEAFAEMAFPST